MPLIPAKLHPSAELVANVGLKRLAEAMVSRVKNSILESPFLVLGTMIFPAQMLGTCQALHSIALFRAPKSHPRKPTPIRCTKANMPELPNEAPFATHSAPRTSWQRLQPKA